MLRNTTIREQEPTMEIFCGDSNMSVIKDIWKSIPTKEQPEKMTKSKKTAALNPITIDTRNIDRMMAQGKDGDDMFASLLREIDNYGLSMSTTARDETCKEVASNSAPSSTCGEDSFSSEKSTCGETKIFGEEEKLTSSVGEKSTSEKSMMLGEEEDLSPTLRLRGLPYNAREEDVRDFFGYHTRFLRAENPISLIPNRDGRPSGLAMVSFVSQATARIAQRDLDRKMMGTRYIEVFGPLNHNTHRFMKNPGPMTEVMVLRELRALLRKKGAMLMSMLGVLLSDEGRQFLKSQGIGLKAFFQRVEDEFVVEGKKGEEKVIWLHPKNSTLAPPPTQVPNGNMSCVSMDVPMNNGIQQQKPTYPHTVSAHHEARSKVSAPHTTIGHNGFKIGAHIPSSINGQERGFTGMNNSSFNGASHHHLGPHGKERGLNHQKHAAQGGGKKFSSMDKQQRFAGTGSMNAVVGAGTGSMHGGAASSASSTNFTPAVITTRETRYGEEHASTSGANGGGAGQHQHHMAVPHVLWPTCY